MRKLVTIAAGITAAVALVATASAHSAAVLDRDDSEGPLDVAAVQAKHKKGADGGGQYVELELVTYEEWDASMAAGARNFVTFEFDWDRDGGAERCVVVRATQMDGEDFLRADVARDCVYLNDDTIGPALSISRPDEHSVVVRVARKDVARPRTDYRWRAVTSFEEQPQGSPCAAPEPHGDGGYGTCADTTSWVRHSSQR